MKVVTSQILLIKTWWKTSTWHLENWLKLKASKTSLFHKIDIIRDFKWHTLSNQFLYYNTQIVINATRWQGTFYDKELHSLFNFNEHKRLCISSRTDVLCMSWMLIRHFWNAFFWYNNFCWFSLNSHNSK